MSLKIPFLMDKIHVQYQQGFAPAGFGVDVWTAGGSHSVCTDTALKHVQLPQHDSAKLSAHKSLA